MLYSTQLPKDQQFPRVACAAFIAICLFLPGCSDENDSGGTSLEFTSRAAEQTTGPIEGKGIVYPQPAVRARQGYVEEEFFVGGTATSFKLTNDTPASGYWDAEPDTEAEYLTRVIVRRPPPEEFSGTVVVEWLNVTAIEAGPDWAYLYEEIGRAGHAYIAVSTQAQGVEGGDTLLNVGIDEEAAAEAGASGEDDSSGLVNINPDRYGTLHHPGDQYTYDIFSQVGRTVKEDATLLNGQLAEQVIAIGESQSAYFLTTYVNAVHPIDQVYDGIIIHSRGASSAPIDGMFLSSDDEFFAENVLVRDDLYVPVLIFETETDLTMLGYATARQPDTEFIRTWEVAGTAHTDAHVFRAIIGGPRDPSVGRLIGCTEPINIGPHHEVVQAALHHMVVWAKGGAAPPSAPRLELVEGDELAIARDENQLALGGIRTPLVDVPVYAPVGDPPVSLSGDTTSEDFDLCALFGQTFPFDQSTIISLHGTAEDYLAAFIASAEATVAAGFLLQADADQLIEEAESNTALFD